MREAEALRLQVQQMPAIRKVYKLTKRITMNENLNLVEILKDCPKGTKLYSTLFGDVELVSVYKNEKDAFPIEVKRSDGKPTTFTKNGRFYFGYDGECALFPSREQRDWSKFKVKKPKFDPKTLKPFDRVLVRDSCNDTWCCGFFSHIAVFDDVYRYCTEMKLYEKCIPYNNDTKYLLGTIGEAPEFYKYWED